MLVAVLGGLLGILMMIPLRRALIVEQHGMLKYPEGTACAEVLKAGASRESRAAAHRRRGIARASPTRRRPRQDHLHRLRHRLRLQGAPCASSSAGTTTPTKESSARRSQRGSVAAENLTRAARRRLHHRPADRVDHVRRRRPRLPRAHPDDHSSSARAGDAASRPRHRCRSARWAPDDIRNAYVLYIGAGAVAAGGIISLAALAADHLARAQGRTGGFARLARRDGLGRRRAPTATSR